MLLIDACHAALLGEEDYTKFFNAESGDAIGDSKTKSEVLSSKSGYIFQLTCSSSGAGEIDPDIWQMDESANATQPIRTGSRF